MGEVKKEHVKRRFGVRIVETWAGIAVELGKAERTVKYYSRLDVDPLPIRKAGQFGRVWIPYEDLMAWADRRGLGIR